MSLFWIPSRHRLLPLCNIVKAKNDVSSPRQKIKSMKKMEQCSDIRYTSNFQESKQFLSFWHFYFDYFYQIFSRSKNERKVEKTPWYLMLVFNFWFSVTNFPIIYSLSEFLRFVKWKLMLLYLDLFSYQVVSISKKNYWVQKLRK